MTARRTWSQARQAASVLAQRCVLLPLSSLVPRRAGRWAFGAPQDGFSGNTKYLFLWTAQHCTEIEAVWLTGSEATRDLLRSRGLRCELRWSWHGVKAAATAHYHVVGNDGSDTNFALTGGATVLNLWHGVGIKNILRGARIGHNAELFAKRWRPDVRLRAMHRLRRPDFVLSTSPAMTAHFARCFDLPPQRCVELGYPRLDPYVDDEFRERCLTFGDYDALRAGIAGRTVYLYAPTLRDDDQDMLAEAVPDFAALSQALRPTNGVLLLKLHPFTLARVTGGVSQHDNIVVWPAELDLYPVLAEMDCLITDYSSLLYDYLAVADAGVVVYAFDHDRYVAKDRDLAFPFEQNIVGVRADSFDRLCEVLRDGTALDALPSDRLAELRQRFWGSSAPPRHVASAAIVEFARQREAPQRQRQTARSSNQTPTRRPGRL